MNRTALLLLALGLGSASWLHAAEPMSFQELSLLVRAGVAPQEIVNDAARRKLLQPLTVEQQQSLQASGASPALLNALQSATLVASPDEAAAYRAHHQAARPAAPTPADPAAPAPPAALQAVVLPDHFTEGLEAAKTVPEHPVRATDAFNLSQMADAKAQALRERKPIGFVLMTPAMLDKPVTTRDPGAASAFAHFYESFKDSLVLVFVPNETKPEQLPPAVAAGFTSKEMNGVVPNMTVTDATASALIVAVPCGNAKTTGPDRDKIFTLAASITQRWLTFHPMAIGVPSPPAGPAPK